MRIPLLQKTKKLEADTPGLRSTRMRGVSVRRSFLIKTLNLRKIYGAERNQ